MMSIFKESERYTYREFYDRIDRWNWMEVVRILKIILAPGNRLWWDTQSLKSVTDSHPSDPRLSVQNVQVDLQMEEEQDVQWLRLHHEVKSRWGIIWNHGYVCRASFLYPGDITKAITNEP